MILQLGAGAAEVDGDGLRRQRFSTGLRLDTRIIGSISAPLPATQPEVPPGPGRRDIAPHPPDAQIIGADLDAVAARIGLSCTP